MWIVSTCCDPFFFLDDRLELGFLPLHFACKGDSPGNIAVIKYIIEIHGMDVDQVAEDRDINRKWTPLHVAALCERDEVPP